MQVIWSQEASIRTYCLRVTISELHPGDIRRISFAMNKNAGLANASPAYLDFLGHGNMLLAVGARDFSKIRWQPAIHPPGQLLILKCAFRRI